MCNAQIQVSWCSWLALQTLNLASRVQIPVRPYFFGNIFTLKKLRHFNLVSSVGRARDF